MAYIKDYEEAPSYTEEDFTNTFVTYATDELNFQGANNPVDMQEFMSFLEECNMAQAMKQDQPITSSSKLTVQQLDIPEIDTPEVLYKDTVNSTTCKNYDYSDHQQSHKSSRSLMTTCEHWLTTTQLTDDDESPMVMCESFTFAKSYKISYSLLDPIPEYIRWKSKDMKEEDLYYLV
ncbi:hypothetical protein J3A83DRAFT_4198134 [Scleroderma citrinum]